MTGLGGRQTHIQKLSAWAREAVLLGSLWAVRPMQGQEEKEKKQRVFRLVWEFS